MLINNTHISHFGLSLDDTAVIHHPSIVQFKTSFLEARKFTYYLGCELQLTRFSDDSYHLIDQKNKKVGQLHKYDDCTYLVLIKQFLDKECKLS